MFKDCGNFTPAGFLMEVELSADVGSRKLLKGWSDTNCAALHSSARCKMWSDIQLWVGLVGSRLRSCTMIVAEQIMLSADGSSRGWQITLLQCQQLRNWRVCALFFSLTWVHQSSPDVYFKNGVSDVEWLFSFCILQLCMQRLIVLGICSCHFSVLLVNKLCITKGLVECHAAGDAVLFAECLNNNQSFLFSTVPCSLDPSQLWRLIWSA